MILTPVLPSIYAFVVPSYAAWGAPGTYHFTVPNYNSMDLVLKAAGGGAGGSSANQNGKNGTAGGNSFIYVDSNVLTAIGGAYGTSVWTDSDGSGHVYRGIDGGAGSATGPGSVTSGGGGRGGSAVRLSNAANNGYGNGWQLSGKGGNGGLITLTLVNGQGGPKPGEDIAIVIGAHGVSGAYVYPNYTSQYQDNGPAVADDGFASITWR